MREALRISTLLATAALRVQLQYRASFALQMLGNLLVSAADFLAMWALFARFGGLGGWDFADGLLLFATVGVSFAIACLIAEPFEDVGPLARDGRLDIMMLRPCAITAQVAGNGFAPRRVGRVIQAVLILACALHACAPRLDLIGVALIAAAILAGSCLFAGVFVLAGAWALRTFEGTEVVACVSYGGQTTAQFPLSVYARPLRWFFTGVVPLACVSYFPVAAALGRDEGPGRGVSAALLLAGPVFLAASSLVWGASLRRYRSSGS